MYVALDINATSAYKTLENKLIPEPSSNIPSLDQDTMNEHDHTFKNCECKDIAFHAMSERSHLLTLVLSLVLYFVFSVPSLRKNIIVYAKNSSNPLSFKVSVVALLVQHKHNIRRFHIFWGMYHSNLTICHYDSLDTAIKKKIKQPTRKQFSM